MFATAYLAGPLRGAELAAIIQRTISAVKDLKFDAIAFSGMSGALVAPAVAAALGKDLLMVRKPHLGTSSCYSVEGNLNSKFYIIIDDFIAGGATINNIIENIKLTSNAALVGIILYAQHDDTKLDLYTEYVKAPCVALQPPATLCIKDAVQNTHAQSYISEHEG